MARSDKRYAVYPATKAVEVLGPSIPALNQAVECWAALLARAIADNSRTFYQEDRVDMHLMKKLWQMNEWSLLAEAIKGVRFDPEFANPGELLATAVEDAHRLEYIGSKCLDWGDCDSTVIKEKHIDAEVQRTFEKLRSLDYVHAWAVIVVVRWFWDHHNEGIDLLKDDWWTLAFRRQWNKDHAQCDEKRPRGPRGTRRNEKRYSIYPSPKAVEVVGDSLPALNQAIECWATLLGRATADNHKSFHEPNLDREGPRGFGEWSMLAEVLKGIRFDPEFMNPGRLIASAVEDAHRLENLGQRFYLYETDTTVSSIFKDREPEIDSSVTRLVEKLQNPEFDYVHAWAVIVAVQWYWEHNKGLEPLMDPWWTLGFRREWKKKQFAEKKYKQEKKDRKRERKPV